MSGHTPWRDLKHKVGPQQPALIVDKPLEHQQKEEAQSSPRDRESDSGRRHRQPKA